MQPAVTIIWLGS